MGGSQPTTVGRGIISNLIRSIAYELAAVDISIEGPWKMLSVDQTGCSFRGCTGCPEPGYAPKTNPFGGRRIKLSGGQQEFING